MTNLLNGEHKEYETEIAVHKTIGFIEDERYDYGEIINTSEGPAFVFQENPENIGEYQVIQLNNNTAEEMIIKDAYELVPGSDDSKYIDLKQGYYFSYDYENDGYKRLDIESGEPLYDGAYDKVLPSERDIFDFFIPVDQDHFYLVDDSDYNIYVINKDLELVNSISLFASEHEMDQYDGQLYWE